MSKNSKHKRPVSKNISMPRSEGISPAGNPEQPEQAQINAAEVQEPVEDMVIQFGAYEVSTAEILEKVKKNYLDDSGTEIKSLKIYVKPEDNKAYYVVNGETEGNVELVSNS